MKVQVAIATTQGLVYIQELTEEAADVTPTVCLNGTSRQLALSGSYAEFVRKPSGRVEHDFGIASWRLDISNNIDSGESWQLGVYLAHYLNSVGELGDGKPATGDLLIVTSGQVLYNGKVLAIEFVPDKMSAARETLQDFENQGVSIRVMMQHDNLIDVVGYEQYELNHVDDLPQLFSKTSHKSLPAIKPPTTRLARRGTMLSLLLLLSVLGTGYVFYQLMGPASAGIQHGGSGGGRLDDFGHIEPMPAAEMPGVPTIEVWVSEEPWLCYSKDMQVDLLPLRNGRFEPVSTEDLCGLRIHQTRSEQRSAYLFALDSGAFRELSWSRENNIPGWEIPTPGRTRFDRHYTLLIFDQYLSLGESRRLQALLEEHRPYSRQPQAELTELLASIEMPAEVFSHTLLKR